MKLTLVLRASANDDPEDDRWIVEGYASMPGPKSDNVDIPLDVMRAALPIDGLPIYAKHEDDGDSGKMVGRTLSAFVDDVGLFVRAMISRAESNLWTKITEGLLRDFSIMAHAAVERMPSGIMRAKKVVFRHIAIVPEPLDPGAGFAVARSVEDEDASVPCTGGGGDGGRAALLAAMAMAAATMSGAMIAAATVFPGRHE